MAVESERARDWVSNTLAADATFVAACPGGVWLDAAPEGTTTSPICVLTVRSAADLTTFNGVRVWSDALVDVKIAGPVSSYAAVLTAADRADTLLQRQRGGAGGGTVLGAWRQQVITMPEPALIAGQQWHDIVQSYRTLATVP